MSYTEEVPKERGYEIIGVLLLVFTLLLFLALVSDGYRGDTHRALSTMGDTHNLGGKPGAVVASVLYVLLGHGAHVLYFLTGVWAFMLLGHRPLDRLPTRLLGASVLTVSIAALLQLVFADGTDASMPGGAFGAYAVRLLMPNFGPICSYVIATTLVIIGLLLSTEFLLLRAIKGLYDACALVVLVLMRGTGAVHGAWRQHQEKAAENSGEERKARHRILTGLPDSDNEFQVDALTDAEPFDAEPILTEDMQDAVYDPVYETPVYGMPYDNVTEEYEEPAPLPRQETYAPKRDVVRVAEKDPFAEEKPGRNGSSLIDKEPDVALARIRVRTEPTKPVVQEEIPFDAVPEVDEPEWLREVPQYNGRSRSNGANTKAAAQEEAVAAFASSFRSADAVSDSPIEEQEEDEPFTALPAFDEEGETAEVEELDEAAPVAAATVADSERAARPAPKKAVPALRRRTAIEDEIPADYVYPRRYKKPPMDLLDVPPPARSMDNLVEALRQTGGLLEKTLETFGIEARVMDVTRGPTITRFELEPAPGIKVSRFMSLADDLALALKSHGVRVEAPIPGKGRVGIEIPNAERDPVLLRELLESRDFKREKGPLVLALGKDIEGEVVPANLATMPHLLVAGATGAGKTVCVKSLLASLLFTKTPEEVQLILIDPKMVELSSFSDIPHLITPVVTDPKKAAAALSWLISEMEERYRLFAQLRVRNIEVYNESVENGEIVAPNSEGEPGESMNLVRKLPYIVCVIDELADLMMLARAEVEDAIMRLAQLARAVGIHLIIATQRPSVNVLTGVIKANFPVRISFQVSSRTDSRCILDEIGAERLIGQGDMLYLPAGRSRPTRIQGAFVSDKEMSALVSYLKLQAPPQYRDEIENFGKAPEQMEDLLNENDDLFDDAVRIVLETGQASISMVQRRLRVGYTRAARLIDMMELKGIVGPHLGSKAREILVEYAPAERDL